MKPEKNPSRNAEDEIDLCKEADSRTAFSKIRIQNTQIRERGNEN